MNSNAEERNWVCNKCEIMKAQCDGVVSPAVASFEPSASNALDSKGVESALTNTDVELAVERQPSMSPRSGKTRTVPTR